MALGPIRDVRFCKVVDVNDPVGAGRIRVRMPGDRDKTDDELSWVFPLLPKMINIRPKVGEAVFVLMGKANDDSSPRYYIGPVTSQDTKIFYDIFNGGADSIFGGGMNDFRKNPKGFKNMQGVYPGNDDVALSGRKNADVIITDDDIRIRSGVKVVNESNHYDVKFNENDPAYIKVKYHPEGLGNGKIHSTATVVADEINLLSNKSATYKKGSGKIELHDRENLVTDSALEDVINRAYKLPYGEQLVEFLRVFVDAFINHTHDYVSLPPNQADIDNINDARTRYLGNSDNDRCPMLSDTVRIN